MQSNEHQYGSVSILEDTLRKFQLKVQQEFSVGSVNGERLEGGGGVKLVGLRLRRKIIPGGSRW